jgi:hypothetical protein
MSECPATTTIGDDDYECELPLEHNADDVPVHRCEWTSVDGDQQTATLTWVTPLGESSRCPRPRDSEAGQFLVSVWAREAVLSLQERAISRIIQR